MHDPKPRNVAGLVKGRLTTGVLSRYLTKPQVTLTAIVIAIALGLSRFSIVESLRPIGEVYLALLQMSVLPFLMAAIPLAMRSAFAQGNAGRLLASVLSWLVLFTGVIAAIGIITPLVVFRLFPIGSATVAAVGGLVGEASRQVDIEFAMDVTRASSALNSEANNWVADFFPSNIFAALSGNQITSVLVFIIIFGIGMAVVERRTGSSLFSELTHLHDVCLLIFEWLNLFVPFGIIALIAPQIARLGSGVLLILAQFLALFAVMSFVVIGASILLTARAIGDRASRAFTAMMKPLTLVAATRNAIACTPLAVDVMTNELKVSRASCELFIPLGFAILRIGFVLHFVAATIFLGALVGRRFSISEMLMLGVLSTIASFGTIGLNGPAGLASFAAVLRPFALSYELALPILLVVDPIIGMLRAAVTVGVTCAVAALAGGRQKGDDAFLDPAISKTAT